MSAPLWPRSSPSQASGSRSSTAPASSESCSNILRHSPPSRGAVGVLRLLARRVELRVVKLGTSGHPLPQTIHGTSKHLTERTGGEIQTSQCTNSPRDIRTSHCTNGSQGTYGHLTVQTASRGVRTSHSTNGPWDIRTSHCTNGGGAVLPTNRNHTYI